MRAKLMTKFVFGFNPPFRIACLHKGRVVSSICREEKEEDNIYHHRKDHPDETRRDNMTRQDGKTRHIVCYQYSSMTIQWVHNSMLVHISICIQCCTTHPLKYYFKIYFYGLLILTFSLGLGIGVPSISRVLEIWTINLNDFSLFMEQLS